MQYPGRPTDSQIQGLDVLAAESDKIISEVNNFISSDLPKLNEELAKEKKAGIKIISQEDFNKEP